MEFDLKTLMPFMLSDAQGQPVTKVDELEDEEMKSWNQESDIKFLAEKGSFMKEGSEKLYSLSFQGVFCLASCGQK